MTSLFIDTTYDITLGILDDDLGWINFETFYGQKVSNILQKETHRLLDANSLKILDLDSVISIAGPGFYTGLRLSEGFADVLIFSGIKHFSFLSYTIPHLAGIENGIWMTKAYRGEYFFHLWNKEVSQNHLIAAKELEGFLSNVDKTSFYIHSENAIDDLSRGLIGERKTTLELLKDNSKNIFSKIINAQIKNESFYFRAPEDEFKVSL